MTRILALLLLLAVPAYAAPSNFALVCTAPCIASDGTTQPAGTVLGKVLAEATWNPGPGKQIVPDTGQAAYVPIPPPPPITIDTAALIARFTNPELVAIAGNPNMLGALIRILSTPTITLTEAQFTARLAALVTAGILTPARATTIATP